MARRILVVDDHRDGAESLARLLQVMGHETAVAYDGLAAVSVAETFRPEVVLLDLGLPGIDGCDAARRIRAEPWGKEMVLIAATGWGQRERTREAGFDHHMIKPVDLGELQNLLANPKPS